MRTRKRKGRWVGFKQNTDHERANPQQECILIYGLLCRERNRKHQQRQVPLETVQSRRSGCVAIHWEEPSRWTSRKGPHLKVTRSTLGTRQIKRKVARTTGTKLKIARVGARAKPVTNIETCIQRRSVSVSRDDGGKKKSWVSEMECTWRRKVTELPRLPRLSDFAVSDTKELKEPAFRYGNR